MVRTMNLSEYAGTLPQEARKRYEEKLKVIGSGTDLYTDTFDTQSPLPPVIFMSILLTIMIIN